MVVSHGCGCDQNMRRVIAPPYASRIRTMTFDLVGAGEFFGSMHHRLKDVRYASATGL